MIVRWQANGGDHVASTADTSSMIERAVACCARGLTRHTVLLPFGSEFGPKSWLALTDPTDLCQAERCEVAAGDAMMRTAQLLM